MDKLKTVYTDLADNILTITLNRPEKRNALTLQLIHELETIIQKTYDDDNIKSAIITGEGEDAFSVGEDWEELQSLPDFSGRKFAETGQEVFRLIENCPKPIVAAINGDTLGGGFELALACHLRIATEQATFGFPQVTKGIIPGFGGTQRLTHVIGKTKALELLLTGDLLTAEEAKEFQLINHVVSYKEAIIKKSRELLYKIMNNMPLAVGGIITCINAAYNPDEDGYQTEANTFANCLKPEHFR